MNPTMPADARAIISSQAFTQAASVAKPAMLPAMREELRLLPAASNHDGTPAWMVQDPINNRFFRIGWIDFEILLRWSHLYPKQIIEAVNSETTLNIDENDINGLVRFLEQHNLLQATSHAAADKLRLRANSVKQGVFDWLLHHYLFFRVPLIRPQAMLATLMPWLSWVYTRTTAFIVLAITMAGLFLVMRQWETFSSTFVDQLSWQGLFGFTLALVFAKMLHEFGHALTATRFGVRVAHMGLAFLVMFPMLYTDTSESWKLSNPRQRLAIASAGIIAELALAGIATLAWSLSPEGSVKSALFYLATTSWILTLAVNASPFMRFDGYFITTDILDLPNLHERSGALARTWMRRTLLGFNEPWVEHLPGNGNKVMIFFALATWLYRFVLFLGIAVLVYFYFFKVLGIFLMGVELLWFIWRPFWSELKVWRERKSEIKHNRKYYALALLLGVLATAFIPWQTSVKGAAWVHSAHQHIIYSPLAGRLISLPAAGLVDAGQPLFVLESPELNLAAKRAKGQAASRGKELLGLMGLENGEEHRAQLQLQKEQFLAESEMYSDDESRLKISAAFAGKLTDLEPQLAPGVWVRPSQALGIIIDPNHWVADVFINEADLHRVNIGNQASLHQVKSMQVTYGKVIEIDTAKTTVLPNAMLDAKTGGNILTLDREKGMPSDALYRVRVQLNKPPSQQQMQLSEVIISGQRSAWLPTVFKRIAAVVVRESGF
ncbi:MAG: site-2 protease family protein [Methylotenera sp.]